MNVHSDRGSWVQFDLEEVAERGTGDCVGFIGKVTWNSGGMDEALGNGVCAVSNHLTYKLFRGKDPRKVFNQTYAFWKKMGGTIQ